MPRLSLSSKDAARGGIAFQEGNVLITESVACVFQYPRNKASGIQSDAFTALVWRGVRCNSEWEPLPLTGEEGDPNAVEIITRMGTLDQIRPGQLEGKDINNTDVEPDDLGSDVGTVGNTFFVAADNARAPRAWGILAESIEKCGFKPDVIQRGITTDFEGMKAHFKTVEGEKYIARRDSTRHKKGEEVTPTNLVCDRIHTYPYDAKPKVSRTTTTAGTTSGTVRPNGSGGVDGMELLKIMLGGGKHPAINKGEAIDGLSPEFKKAVPDGKEVKREVFQKAMVGEVTRRRLPSPAQKAVIDLLKNDEMLIALQAEMVDMNAGQFMLDDLDKPTTVTFGG